MYVRAIPFYVWLFFFNSSVVYGFALIDASSKATLNVSREFPSAAFNWDGNFPGLIEVEDVPELLREGESFDNLGYQELFRRAIELAMQQWNLVEGSFLNLTLNVDPSVQPKSSPNLHTITTAENSNQSTAAFASPVIEGGYIVNCDISISNRKVKLKSLIKTLVHELGHCAALGHSHDHYKAIMGYSRVDQSYRLGADDKAGLIYLYPATEEDAQHLQTIECGSAPASPPGTGLFIWVFLLPVMLSFASNRSFFGKGYRAVNGQDF